MRTLLDTRVVYGIGNGVCNIYEVDGGFEIEVVSNNGSAAVEIAEHDDAWHAWMHPFAAALEIPAAQAADKPWSPLERAIYLALEVAEAGDSDELTTAGEAGQEEGS